MSAAEVLLYAKGQPLLFSSGLFFAIFTAFYGVFTAIKDQRQLRCLWILAFSMFFYYKCSGAFLLLLLALALMDYWVAKRLSKERSASKRKGWLLLSLSGNLGALFYFKYANFLLSNLGLEKLDIVLPVGISFFTFQSLSYTVDIYRKEIKPAKSLLDYLFFATFFPQLVAGPIVRAKQFLPQIRNKLSLNPDAFGRAWFLILGGLFKKAVISDYISLNFVDRVFDNPSLYSALENLAAVYGYALQIYCDFSGYSDMAIGLALLMGFELTLNFDAPYRSASITEFWRRWHISLSSWLRDYLYIPLGGNRKGRWRTYLNLMLTMLLGGLWHGASWKFVAWGAWHGLLLSLERALGLAKRWSGPLAQITAFHAVCLGWIYFRASDFATGTLMLRKIFGGIEILHFTELLAAYPGVFFLILLGYAMHMSPKRWDLGLQGWMSRASLAGKAAMLAGMVWLIVQVQGAQIQPFIYFQF
jgi:D-alanyl-lipoteichoic acid acyltransferase DltB (MBOAT superfamily)